ncbi:hypothetical protein TTHERM_00528460 (macronuclear) [Tetrahymena thermophila SB210]|uniref:Uncharacterized protein n=1 Tax=Tetrahymena thermophila (strain SB210) TaxID=312017 RepID=I7MB94_TETTS|nr:hypothetical protein TTHERM_00528460 [Tetrahymena thermophila SB210]EAS07910.2 hypothetical protein TTHERM_00528460 [Tetrahymena thermophila SB210]|eukprot:XP_001028152.2 hypothetical protein TTHERM_00528460 [Tetrahymena thermophila SB210]
MIPTDQERQNMFPQNYLINYSSLDRDQDKIIQQGSFVQWQAQEDDDTESPHFFGGKIAGYSNFNDSSFEFQQEEANQNKLIKPIQVKDGRQYTENYNFKSESAERLQNYAQTNTLKKLGNLLDSIENMNNSMNTSKRGSKLLSRVTNRSAKSQEKDLQLKRERSSYCETKNSFCQSETIKVQDVINSQKDDNSFINFNHKQKKDNQNSLIISNILQPSNENNPTQIQTGKVNKLLKLLRNEKFNKSNGKQNIENKMSDLQLGNSELNSKKNHSQKYLNKTSLKHIEYPIHLNSVNEQVNQNTLNNSQQKLQESMISNGSQVNNQTFQTRYQLYRNEIMEKNQMKNNILSSKTAFNICEQYLKKRQSLLQQKMPSVSQCNNSSANNNTQHVRNRTNSYFEEKIYNFIQNYQKKNNNRYFEIMSFLFDKYTSETNYNQKLKHKQSLMQYYNILKQQRDFVPQITNKLTPGERELSNQNQMNEHLQKILQQEKLKVDLIKKVQSQQIVKLNISNQLPSLTYHIKSNLNNSAIVAKPKKKILIASQSSPEKKFRSISQYLQSSESEQTFDTNLALDASQHHYFPKNILSKIPSKNNFELIYKTPKSQSVEKLQQIQQNSQNLIQNSYKNHLDQRKIIQTVKLPVNFFKTKQIMSSSDIKSQKNEYPKDLIKLSSHVFKQIQSKVHQDQQKTLQNIQPINQNSAFILNNNNNYN